MKSKEIILKKKSGFCYSISASIIDTPKGSIRTISIIDHEVLMADAPLPPPHNQMTIAYNDNEFDSNKEQLKELCEFILKDLKGSKKKINKK